MTCTIKHLIIRGSFLVPLLFTLVHREAAASDLVEVLPLTPRVIMLHFDDGTVHYRGYHSSSSDDQVLNDPLDTRRAVHLYAYQLFSGDDAAYEGGAHPVRTGRKSKPTAFSDECLWTGSICDNAYVLEHWIYLELPRDLQRGATYTLWVGDLAANVNEVTFTFNEFEQRSELIHVNQLGYLPSARLKFAYLAHWAGDFGPLDLDFLAGSEFYLVDMADRSVAYQGTIQNERRGLGEEASDFGTPEGWGTTNNFFGSDVWEADFSSFTTPGEYRLVVEGVGCSFPFRIGEDAYRQAYYTTTRGLYYQRAGIAKEEAYAGKWAQPRDHHPADGRTTLYYTTWPSVKGGEGSSARDSILAHVVGEISDWGWGWYHDAGDWDGYVHHTDVPFNLMASYEMAPQNFRDGDLNLPESGNGVPDILDEAAWLIRYFRRNQQPDGGIAGGRVHSDFNEKPDAAPSWEDDRPWYVCGPDPQTSYLFAGLAAQYAYCLEMAGIGDSTNLLLEAARQAYQWAGTHHDVAPDEKVKGATVQDLRMYAAASLFKLTGETGYQDDFRALNRVVTAVSGLTGGDYNQRWAVWMFVTAPDHEGTDSELKAQLSEAVINHARNEFIEPAKRRSTRVGYPFNMPAVVGSTTTPITLAPMFAQHVATGAEKQEMIDYMQTTADYFLGNNPLNTSWITGLGDRTPRRLLHLDSRYDQEGIDPYVPGLVPYGPTRHGDHFLGEDAQGPWDADFAKIRSYPDRYDWPISECWFDNPYSVLDGEFTIHQTIAPAASTYGFLAGDAMQPFLPNQEPQLVIAAPVSDLTIDETDTLRVEVEATDDGRIGHVDYFLDDHPLKRVEEAPFELSLPGKDLPPGTHQLNVLAVDNEGLETRVHGASVTVTHPYAPLVIPASGEDTLHQGQSLEVAVEVPVIPDAEATEVSLFLNGMPAGVDDAAPFVFRIDSIHPLFNQFRAVVTYSGGFRAEADLERYAIPGVAGVSYKKKAIEIHAGEYGILEYDIFPAEAVNRQVTFHSLSDSVATVNGEGRISALAEGMALVVITTAEGGFTDTAAVTVLPPRKEGPFHGSPAIVPAVIEAEDYDFGGEGKAYHDLTPGNSEEVYRQEDVDVGSSYDGSAAYHVTAIQPGEWLNYTIEVPETNIYDITFRYTAGSGDPVLTLKSDGKDLRTVTLPEVGWYPFEDGLVEGLYLEAGVQVLTLLFENGGLTLNDFEISCASCTHILPLEIRLNHHNLDIALGGSVQLQAAMIPSGATNQRVYWQVLNDSIVWVDPSGNLTALRTGETAVVAISDARGLTDTCHVRVVPESAYSPGLAYDYFEGTWEKLPPFETMIPLGSGNVPNVDLSPALAEDYFGFRFFGEIRIFTPGTYNFYTASDDGSMLYIDGERVVDNDGAHATIEQGGVIELDTGWHQIEVLYFEIAGGASLEVSYEGAGLGKSVIPDSILARRVIGGELVPLEGISLPDTLHLPLGGSVMVPIVYEPDNASDGKVIFSSEMPGIALVNEYGYAEGLTEGTTWLTAVSREGSFVDSTLIEVFNDTPAIRWTLPAQGAHFADTAHIPLAFVVEDTIGGIAGVRLYLNGELIQSPEAGDLSVLLDPLPAGSHELLLTAEDRYGRNGQSEVLRIEVDSPGTGILPASLHFADITAIPNPFSDRIRFGIRLVRPEVVRLDIYDMTGSMVYTSGPHQLQEGFTVMEWDGFSPGGHPVPPGIYLTHWSLRHGASTTVLQLKVIRE